MCIPGFPYTVKLNDSHNPRTKLKNVMVEKLECHVFARTAIGFIFYWLDTHETTMGVSLSSLIHATATREIIVPKFSRFGLVVLTF